LSNLYLERQSLYELVWSKPIKLISVDLKISEPNLISRCVELEIPRPLEGYWRAVAKGAAPAVPALPPFKHKESINPPNQPDAPKVTESESEQPLLSSSKSVAKGRPKSPSRSTLGAQLFSTAKEILLKSQITELGYYKPSKRKLLDVNVTDSGLSDAEAFLLKLFAAAEKGGLRIRLAEMNFFLSRLSAFDLSIIEFSDDFRHVWTLRFWTHGRWVQNRVSYGVDSSNSRWTAMDTKKPAGLAPCGLSGLQRTILVSPRKNFGGAGGS